MAAIFRCARILNVPDFRANPLCREACVGSLAYFRQNILPGALSSCDIWAAVSPVTERH